jgi:hypothetical protein
MEEAINYLIDQSNAFLVLWVMIFLAMVFYLNNLKNEIINKLKPPTRLRPFSPRAVSKRVELRKLYAKDMVDALHALEGYKSNFYEAVAKDDYAAMTWWDAKQKVQRDYINELLAFNYHCVWQTYNKHVHNHLHTLYTDEDVKRAYEEIDEWK